jgi:hypothetical protein
LANRRGRLERVAGAAEEKEKGMSALAIAKRTLVQFPTNTRIKPTREAGSA